MSTEVKLNHEEAVVITNIANAYAIFFANKNKAFNSTKLQEKLNKNEVGYLNQALEKNGIINEGMLSSFIYMLLVVPYELKKRNRKNYPLYSKALNSINKDLQRDDNQYRGTQIEPSRNNPDFIRHMRNAAAHANIILVDNYFFTFTNETTFKNKNDKNDKNDKKTYVFKIPKNKVDLLIYDLLLAAKQITIDLKNKSNLTSETKSPNAKA